MSADSPSSDNLVLSPIKSHHSYHLTVVPAIGIAVTVFAFVMLVILIVLIQRKKRELDDSKGMDSNLKTCPSPHPRSIIHEGANFF